MRCWVKVLLVVGLLGILYWPGIQHHWQVVQDPYFVPFDAVQYVPPFFKFDPKDPIPTTYVKEYYLSAVCPLLYKWLTIVGMQFSDVRHFQLGMMYLSYAVFVIVMGRIGWLLGGAALSFAVIALTVAAWIFIGLGFIGGAPRMYAYPLISLLLYSLVRDRPYLLAVITVLGALLYPVVATIGGLCLASWFIFRPLATGVVEQWGWARRLTTLGVVGFLAIAGLVPMILGSTPYGRRVIESDIIMYPETGPEGGYLPFDRLPYKLFGLESATYFLGPMYSHGDPVAPLLNVHRNFQHTTSLFVLGVTGLIIALIVFHGLKLHLKSNPSGLGIRMISFFAACTALHVIAWTVSPYLFIPNRYFMFSLPFIITLLFPWSLHVIIGHVPAQKPVSKFRAAFFLAIICIYLLAFGGRGNVHVSGFSIAEPSQPLFATIAALPNNAVIAGWPIGEIQKVEYVTRRNIFLTMDVHQVFYIGFVKVMRERMDATFDAYFSTDAAPLYRLRQKFGVTHLLVETRDFTDAKHTPEYFAPWATRIGPRLAEIRGKEYLLSAALQEKTAIFNQNGFLLLDLAKLP